MLQVQLQQIYLSLWMCVFVYDAMWTIVLSLNLSISILEDRGLGRLENFTYDSVEMANVFTEAVALMCHFKEYRLVHSYRNSSRHLNLSHHRDMSL